MIRVYLSTSLWLAGRVSGIFKVWLGQVARDDRGYTLDVHAFRKTFGTMLSKAGVPLRTGQALMRHSKPELTANVYTDVRILDTHGALDGLPTFSLNAQPDTSTHRQAVGGIEHPSTFAVTPAVTPTGAQSCATEGQAGKIGAILATREDTSEFAVSGNPDNDLGSVASPGHQWAVRDSNPRLPACKAGALTN